MRNKINVASVFVLLFLVGMLVYSMFALREEQSVKTQASDITAKVYISPNEQTIEDGAFFSVITDSPVAFQKVNFAMNFNNELIRLEDTPQLLDNRFELVAVSSANEANQNGVIEAELNAKKGEVIKGTVQLLGLDFNNLAEDPLQSTLHIGNGTKLIDIRGSEITTEIEHASISLRKHLESFSE